MTEGKISEPAAVEPIGPANIFTFRGENVISQLLPAVTPDNVDGIHDVRVAIRRLRTAMRDLSPMVGSNEMDETDKRLKAVASLAGKVRDHDVTIRMLGNLAADTPQAPITEGLQTMISSREKKRISRFAELVDLLTPDFIDELSSRIRSQAVTCGGLYRYERFNELRNSVITRRRDDFLGLIPFLYDPLDADSHHKLRIAAKRLRYSVELFADDSDQTSADVIAEMQDYLGNKHDCDVWIRKLRKTLKRHLKNGGAITSEFLAGEWILGKFVRMGSKNYRNSLKIWADWRDAHFLDGLAKV